MKKQIEKQWNNPSGINSKDTLVDALKRADQLSDPNGGQYSGMMCDRKDLRRIVLLAREYRRMKILLDGNACPSVEAGWCKDKIKDCPFFLPESDKAGADGGCECEI